MLALPALVLLLAGCLRLGEDYSRPDLPAKVPGRYDQAKSLKPYLPQDEWWKSFGDRELNLLVAQAFSRNLDIKEAAARVMQVRARYIQFRASQFPQLDLEGGYLRRQSGEAPSSQLFNAARRTDTYSLSLAAAFELDLWGRLSRGSEAAWAQILAAEESRRVVVQSIIAAVVNSYLLIEANERRLQVVQHGVEAVGETLARAENRYQRGLVSILDVQQAARTLATAQASLPALRKELGESQQRLQVLVGSYPRGGKARFQPDDYFLHIKPVPPGLPAELLRRRPDLRAAEAQVMAANARVGAALAARFPAIRLTGSFGYASDSLSNMFGYQHEFWSLAAGILQPLFDGSRLEARQREAEAALAGEVAAYAKKVLSAFSEVERSLLTRREQKERRELLRNALSQARRTQQTAEERYQRGLVEYITVLDAQRTRYDLEDRLILSELSLLTNRVSLHLALGGGWDALAEPPVRISGQSPVSPGAAPGKAKPGLDISIQPKIPGER